MAEERMAELLERLRSGRPVVRLEAAKALGEMGEGAVVPEVLEALVERLRDDEAPEVRREVAEALAKMAFGASWDVKRAVATPEVVRALRERLGDDDPEVRTYAAHALGMMGPAAARPEVLEALVERLKDENEWVRMEAAQALGGMGPAAAAPEVVGALLERFWDEEGDVGSAAAQALGWLAADYPEVVLAILPHLRDASERVRGHALFALDSMLDALEIRPVPATPEVLEALRECLGGEQDVRVRQVVARLLGMMGRAAGRPARSPGRWDRRRGGGRRKH
jgi:HEAT repeat protein